MANNNATITQQRNQQKQVQVVVFGSKIGSNGSGNDGNVTAQQQCNGNGDEL
jgi:hypothetical protein